MQVLVVIANYGTKNDPYLAKVLEGYRAMAHSVKLIVLCSQPKDLGPDVEVVVQPPTAHPWTFPFPHKQMFADRLEEFDLFIYSEDDMPVTQRNLDAFLAVTRVLPADEIAGFIRSETDTNGEAYCPEAHGEFHWDPASVRVREHYTFASFTNDHAAAYVLTRDQLKRAIASGGFLVPPHEGRYDLLVSAATDPYTQCGMKKVVCISHIDDFVLPHLPNKYIGKLGLKMSEMKLHIAALMEIARGARPAAALIPGETKLPLAMWSKDFYEPASGELLSAVPRSAMRILSVGCGWGALEEALQAHGARVTAVPLNSVIAASAESRGVETVCGNLQSAREALQGRTFDCLIVANLAHLAADPSHMLSSFRELVRAGGHVIVSAPNFASLPVRARRLQRRAGYSSLGNYEKTGVHATTRGDVAAWFRSAGIRSGKTAWLRKKLAAGPRKPLGTRLSDVAFAFARPLFARDFIAMGRVA